jgi:hypothetical protein
MCSNVAYGILCTLGTIGSVIAPPIADLVCAPCPVCTPNGQCAQNVVNVDYPPFIFGMLCMLSALFTMCLPETKDSELPEDLNDVRKGPFLELCEKAFNKMRCGYNQAIS